MSRNYWMEHTPLGVILIVAASLVAVAFFNEHKRTEAEYHAARKEYEAGKSVIPPDVAARRVHTDYKSYREEWRDEQDLEAQREMARTSWWVMVATWIGVALLVATLWETFRTTAAATEAAVAARKQSDVAEESFRRLERPYVIPMIVGGVKSAVRSDGSNLHHIEYTVGNYGRTPAIVHYIDTSFGPEPTNHPTDRGIRKIENDFNSGHIIPADKVDTPSGRAYLPAVVEVTVGAQPRAKALKINGAEDVYLVFITKFEDAFGVIREGRFTWRYDNRRHIFRRHSGKEFNYERETLPS